METKTKEKIHSVLDGLLATLLAGLTILLGVAMYASLKWRMYWDLPVIVYPVFAIDRFGLVPYRDLFDINMVGTYFFHYLWGHFLGYTDFSARVADMTYLGVLMAAMAFTLKRLGRLAAWTAPLLFGMAYLTRAGGMSLQREYLMLPMIVLAAGCAMTFSQRRAGTAALLIGLCFGAASCIKPHAGIGLPVIALFLFLDSQDRETPFLTRCRRFAVPVALMGVGLALPVGVLLTYLAWKGALKDFLDMAVHYWPMYGQLSSGHVILHPGERWPYIWKNFMILGGLPLWYFPALLGLYTALTNPSYDAQQRRQVYMLAGLAFSYSLYPVVQAQFFNYHWLPFLFFLTALTSLNTVASTRTWAVLPRLIPLAVLLMVIFNQSAAAKKFAPLFPPGTPKRLETTDRIAEYLKKNLHPGDTVQPLDWVSGGILHAMLIAEAKVATPFLYDVNFYHHVSTPYIQELRRRFIEDLERAAPRYILKNNRPKAGCIVSGPDTSCDFPELTKLLDTAYSPVFYAKECTVFERRTPENHSLSPETPPAIPPEPATTTSDALPTAMVLPSAP